ncbi:hypothetical protein COLO4_37465 [Corchorus olitorius]|uniref:Uncharacterized protein n=1 Tax=Corchorus olitorius TaxID=93759 RepID=A0A1R3G1H1_9ROSI|nr:hypothetical protein COLO4_37465 [Corchorus olitorius]
MKLDTLGNIHNPNICSNIDMLPPSTPIDNSNQQSQPLISVINNSHLNGKFLTSDNLHDTSAMQDFGYQPRNIPLSHITTPPLTNPSNIYVPSINTQSPLPTSLLSHPSTNNRTRELPSTLSDSQPRPQSEPKSSTLPEQKTKGLLPTPCQAPSGFHNQIGFIPTDTKEVKPRTKASNEQCLNNTGLKPSSATASSHGRGKARTRPSKQSSYAKNNKGTTTKSPHCPIDNPSSLAALSSTQLISIKSLENNQLFTPPSTHF